MRASSRRAPARRGEALAACGSGGPGGDFVAAVAWYIISSSATDKGAESAGMCGNVRRAVLGGAA
jgi:hypothetical protein